MSVRFAVLLLTFASTVPLLATPGSCTTRTAQQYQNSDGCFADPFTFKNFNWFNESGDNLVNVPSSQVLLTPSFSNGRIDVLISSDSFDVSGTDRIKVFLEYTIDPPPPILDDFSLELFAQTPTNGGFAIITSLICVGDLFSNGCEGGTVRSLSVQNFGAGDPRTDIGARTIRFGGVSVLDTRTSIELVANGGRSQISGYGNTVIPGADTPEPATGLVMAPVIAGLFLFARRRSRAN
ncbi:MAG: hypothetical protein H7039_12405 [Bryobacteraceae bacterium]|nr:hypothetical protein [Bryobacteraceae bacterium]